MTIGPFYVLVAPSLTDLRATQEPERCPSPRPYAPHLPPTFAPVSEGAGAGPLEIPGGGGPPTAPGPVVDLSPEGVF